MNGRLVLGSAVLGAVLILACAHAGFVPQPTVSDVDRVQPIEPGLTLAEMQAGPLVLRPALQQLSSGPWTWGVPR